MSKTRKKRVLAALLCVMLLAGMLAGCGSKDDEGGKQQLSEFVYVPNYVTIDAEIPYMNSLCYAGDIIYFSTNLPVHADGRLVTDEELKEIEEYYANMDAAVNNFDTSPAQPDTSVAVSSDDVLRPDSDISYIPFICSIKTDGSGYTQLKDYIPPQKPEGQYGHVNMDRICADNEGNIWVAETVNQTIFNPPEGFDETTGDIWEYYERDESKTYLRKLSPTGAELGSVDISSYAEIPEGEDARFYSFYIGNMITDAQGNLYVSDGNQTVFVIGSDCEYLFKLENDNWLNTFIPTRDGKVAISTNDESGNMVLKVIDLAAKGWGTESKMPSDAWNTSYGGSLYDFCYTDSSSLYGYDIATETETKILTWLNCDVDSNNIEYSNVLDNGDVFVISRNWNENSNNNYEIVTLVKTPASEVQQKTILTLATVNLYYDFREKILKFNKTNPNYRIEVIDYSEFNTEDDYNAGMTKLNTEIISGNVPDLIDVSNMPYKQYASKGLLEDLYPYLDNDPDYSKEALVQSIVKAAEVDGKLYQLMSGFSVMSIIGNPEVVGTEMGWTMAELQAIIEQHPEADLPFGSYMTRENLLQYFLMLNMDDYMNWETGECSFNSDEFKNLLTFAKTFPSSEEFEAAMKDYEWVEPAVLIREGRQLVSMFSASDFDSFQYEKNAFGGNITFKGLPSADKSGNIATISSGIAMTTSCKDKDGAWQFIREIISDESQKNQWYFPVVQKIYDENLAEAMKQEYTTDENGNQIPVPHGGMSYGNGEAISFYAITREEADQFNAMINSVTKLFSYDMTVIDRINEDVQAFFAGEKDVNQTAETIQSRMNIYLNEQR